MNVNIYEGRLAKSHDIIKTIYTATMMVAPHKGDLIELNDEDHDYEVFEVKDIVYCYDTNEIEIFVEEYDWEI